jgi:hypothetical protein
LREFPSRPENLGISKEVNSAVLAFVREVVEQEAAATEASEWSKTKCSAAISIFSGAPNS